jgi:hypothetical protein
MQTIGNPMQIPELELKPEPCGAIKLSDDMQQVLSLIAGYWKNKRVLLKASSLGVLFVSSPQITDIFHVTATGDNYLYAGEDIECTDVLIMGHPNNTDTIWAKPHLQADTNNSWPLLKKECIDFTLSSLSQLHLRFVKSGDIAIIAYTI